MTCVRVAERYLFPGHGGRGEHVPKKGERMVPHVNPCFEPLFSGLMSREVQLNYAAKNKQPSTSRISP